ncbi:hypothetical protein AGRA3207_004821 [Actinomadura graeca]|uniref:Secreted protein n=1 Tax=Actinomadura graeca TaxID=2750812 RepID=A0ABX8QY79_9ACTN|nr:hypothetical protein [Actinomadura graeca]QXJ23638.1 hypothetical protein AGRA3207_004821 [Actinomadura graeca]
MNEQRLIMGAVGTAMTAMLTLGVAGTAAHAGTAGHAVHTGIANTTVTPLVQEGAERPATRADLRAAGVPSSELTAAAWKTKSVKLRWCWGEKKPKVGGLGGWRCKFLAAWTNAAFTYNGKKVYQHRVNCDDQGTYDVKWSWCGYARNGKPWMSAGGNFKARLGIGNASASRAYWQRVYITSKGVVTASGKPA